VGGAKQPAERPALWIERSERDGATHLELVGELDLSTVDPLKLRLELVEKEEPETMVVDLSRVTFMDSMGLGILLSHHLMAKQAGRRFLLVEGPEHVQKVFDITGIRDRFEWVEAPSEPARRRSRG
jgi:anti-anti-sigma factor